MRKLNYQETSRIQRWIWAWCFWLIFWPVTGIIKAVLQIGEESENIPPHDSTIGLTVLFFGPTLLAMVPIIIKLGRWIVSIHLGPYQQRRILKHLRIISGVQALIGLAFATITAQVDPNAVVTDFFVMCLLWSGGALIYFAFYYYQLKIEEDIKLAVVEEAIAVRKIATTVADEAKSTEFETSSRPQKTLYKYRKNLNKLSSAVHDQQEALRKLRNGLK